MHLALYAPGEGYYNSHLPKLGAAGDFVTAPELTPLFAMTLANQCQQILIHMTRPDILEFGAGSGALCVALLKQLAVLNCVPEHYFILEVSANLRQRQEELFRQEIPEFIDKIIWCTQWPEHPFHGVVLANEVLDAMPVHRFMCTETEILESYIGLDDQGGLHEQFKPCTNDRLRNYVEQLPVLELPYISEVNLFIDDWLMQLGAIVQQGAVFLIDYGFPRHEYHHPDRCQGPIMCHYQHHSHPDPLLHPGEQDITAHVDFTHVAEAGQQAGFHIAGFTNQASFLLANGLLSLLNSADNELVQVQAKQAIKQLTLPSEMGELFKVIALSKDVEISLNGFLLNDKRVSL